MRDSRIWKIAVVGAVLLAASACAKKSTPPQSGGGSPTGSSSGTPIPAYTTLTQGTLQVASCLDYSPFETVKQGTPQGFDVDITDAVAAKLGVTVKWIKTDFDSSFSALHGNKFDMIAAAVTATGKLGMQRSQVVDFSDFYFNSRQSLTVNTNKTPQITSTDQLMSGDIVGVQKGTTGEAWAQANLMPKGVQIKHFSQSPDSFTDLEAGNITGVINDGPSSDAIAAEHPGLKVVQYIDTNEKYAFAFSPSNPGLLAAWNVGLKEVISDGEYATIFMKWFPGATVPPEFSKT